MAVITPLVIAIIKAITAKKLEIVIRVFLLKWGWYENSLRCVEIV